MSNITIDLIDHLGDDLRVANVARVSFAKWKEEFDENDARLIDYLATHEHSSPFRHTALSFRCSVPLFLARQLGKHQVGLSWNEVSRRYVDTNIEFYVPDSWHSRPSGSLKQGCGDVHVNTDGISRAYAGHVAESMSLYNELIEEGIAPEEARVVLPQSMMVDFVWTGSLQAFYHVYRLRSGEGAQLVAREFADKLAEIIKPLFPHCWEALSK